MFVRSLQVTSSVPDAGVRSSGKLLILTCVHFEVLICQTGVLQQQCSHVQAPLTCGALQIDVSLGGGLRRAEQGGDNNHVWTP